MSETPTIGRIVLLNRKGYPPYAAIVSGISVGRGENVVDLHVFMRVGQPAVECFENVSEGPLEGRWSWPPRVSRAASIPPAAALKSPGRTPQGEPYPTTVEGTAAEVLVMTQDLVAYLRLRDSAPGRLGEPCPIYDQFLSELVGAVIRYEAALSRQESAQQEPIK